MLTISNLTPRVDTTASSGNTPGVVIVPIQWTPPTDDPDAGVSLYYTRTSRVQPGAVIPEWGVIAENLPAASGQYNWDMSYLRAGAYHVYAQVSDTQQPRSLTAASGTMPGYRTVVAPGRVTLLDTVDPETPTNLTLTSLRHGLQACWDANAANDLAGYLLKYTVTTLNGQPVNHTLRVPATVQFKPNAVPARQCNRIGGLNATTQIPVTISAL